jgi:carbon monoxide dehydrogenase subunit G
MKLRNEVVVAASVEETWQTLLDVPRVARALPGASIEADGVEGVYRGTMRVKLGPVTTEYTGAATLEDADEDERVATFRVQGREARGQGTATATITNRLVSEEAGATRVIVETELAITGRAAQFGRGILEDVSGRLLEQFASRLEAEVLGGEAARAGVPAATRDEVLDLGGAAWRPLLRRYGWIALVGAAAIALAVAARSRTVVIVVERR